MRQITRSVAIALLLAASPEDSHAACLKFGPATVSLRGTVERETLSGPPNYESAATGDAAETFWFLNLSEPVCVSGSPDETLEPPETGIVRVQLLLTQAQYSRHSKMVGTPVVATGTLVHSISGHHHTPVLLKVRELRSAR